MAVMRSESIARWAAGGRELVSPQLTTPGRLQARMLISTMIAAVTGTVYFSKVRMA